MMVIEKIKQRLSAARILEAAIIDETFDGISQEALQPGWEQFLDQLEDEEFFKEAQAICPTLNEPADFDIDKARELWEGRERWGERLRAPAELLLSVYSQRLNTLNQLADSLSQLGLTLHKVGSTSLPPESVNLVFLDYCLQPERENQLVEARKERLSQGLTISTANHQPLKSEQVAQELAKRGRPFLVLISDRSELSLIHDDFRRQTSYLGGTFAFLPKSEALKRESLYFHFGCWGVGHPALLPIHSFFDAIANAVEGTMEEFKQTLLSLDVQDYSYIQRLSLSADGEPLGEYMLKLITTALSYRLSSYPGVNSAKKVLDAQHFETHLPSFSQPRQELRRLYQHATTDPNVDDIAPHPLHRYETTTTVMPLLATGDILAKNDSESVYMVVNAACDLQFSPVNADRQADPARSIFMLPGKLEPLNQTAERWSGKRTELFELNGSAYRILWQHKHVISMPLGQVQTWCSQNAYRRVARMGIVYALAIQQMWTADISRVGVMVTPPLTESADYQIYLRNADGLFEPFEDRIKGEIILGSKRKNNKDTSCFLITRQAVNHIRKALKITSEQFETYAANLPEALPNRAQKSGDLGRHAKRAIEAYEDCDAWFEFLETEHDLERVDGRQSPNPDSSKMPINFFWQKSPAGLGFGALGGGNILMVVDIRLPESIPTPPQITTTANEVA